jgi:hypothetical protein
MSFNFLDRLPRNPRISIHTSCKGRARYVLESLPGNLAAAKKDGNCEVVLLSYTSPDGLGGAVKQRWMSWIRKGLLTYYFIGGQKYFRFSHARNLAAKLCTGSIVVNVDSDICIGPGYLPLLRKQFADVGPLQVVHLRGMAGWLAMVKQHLFELGGYDERMDDGYGREDSDLINRARAAGLFVSVIEPPKGWKRWHHEGGIKDRFGRAFHERKVDWRFLQEEHQRMSNKSLRERRLLANPGKSPGYATAVRKNFEEIVSVD